MKKTIKLPKYDLIARACSVLKNEADNKTFVYFVPAVNLKYSHFLRAFLTCDKENNYESLVIYNEKNEGFCVFLKDIPELQAPSRVTLENIDRRVVFLEKLRDYFLEVVKKSIRDE